MEQQDTQVLFFQHIRSILPSHLSFVDEIADLLSISNDSAYRRIRGEKPISLDEMQKLAKQFKISIDQFLHIQTDSYIFSGSLLGEEEQAFETWMTNVLKQLQLINSFQHKHLYYLAKDVPIMDQFMHHDLFAFKSFLWRRSILLYEELKGKKFYLKDARPEHLDLALARAGLPESAHDPDLEPGKHQQLHPADRLLPRSRHVRGSGRHRKGLSVIIATRRSPGIAGRKRDEIRFRDETGDRDSIL